MLDFMRRNARSWGIKVALGAIVIVFVFFMGGGGQIGAGPVALVTVGDIEITRPEFDLAQRRNESYFRQQFQGQVSEQMLKSLNVPRMTLEQLVDGAVLRSEADRLGLSIPPDAVREQLMRVPAFQRGGQFSPGLYRDTLSAQGMSPGAFEETVRQDLLEAQLADIIRRGSHIGEEEAWKQYQRENLRMKLSYVAVDSAAFEQAVTASEDALAKFYEAKQETFRQPPSVKVRYLAYKVADIAGKIDVSDVDLNEYYELNKNTEFQNEEKIGARHILKKIAGDAGDDAKKAARAAIEDIRTRLAEGGNFEEIAKAESDDTGSAVKGGDLGLFGRGRMVPAFEAVAFASEVGATSEIVESDFGFHIIQVYDKKPAGIAPFEEVKDSIKQTLASQKAVERAFDESAEDAAQIADGATLDSIATERGTRVEETPMFTQGTIVPGIGAAPAFMETAFTLEKAGDVSEPVKVGSDYYLVALVERKESQVPPLAEVREEVEAAYRAEQSLELARTRADELLATVKSGTPLSQVASENDLTLETADEVGGNANFVKGIGSVPGLSEVAFAATKDGEALSRSFVSGTKAYIFVRDGVTEATREAFDVVKDDEIERLENAREQRALKDFIEARKRELQANDEIAFDNAQLRPLLGDTTPVVQ
ncbi:MAG: SurA N-terminal domain-containing protein [Candidatus Binatia bacterium]